ncbi:MAG: GNAT family N-acetyltransferase [Saprospiraceae bacterium]
MTSPTLSTERLRLRLIKLSDLNSIHALHSITAIDEFNTLGIPNSIQETTAIVENWIAESIDTEPTSFTFAIEQSTPNAFVGLIALKIGSSKFKNGEVWYKLHPNYWGKGYATESLSSVLDFGFNNRSLHRIEAGCAVDNIGSIKVLEKVGMTREGRKRLVLPLKTGWSDNFEYAILETDERIKS